LFLVSSVNDSGLLKYLEMVVFERFVYFIGPKEECSKALRTFIPDIKGNVVAIPLQKPGFKPVATDSEVGITSEYLFDICRISRLPVFSKITEEKLVRNLLYK